MDNVKKLFYKGYMGVNNFRIPSLLTTKNGVMIAMVDKGHGLDHGKITLAYRRSLDGGRTWLPMEDLVQFPGGGLTEEAYWPMNIDPSMVQDRETGRIFLVVDFFPESWGNEREGEIEAGTGYKEIDGKQYLVLRDYTGPINAKSFEHEYTVRENGAVYDEEGNATDYTLPDMIDGTLYKNREACGSIFLYTGENRAPISMVSTSFVWLYCSDDDGKTWSKPVDITPQIKKEGEVVFGVGPGVGIQSSSGRLIFPFWSVPDCSTGVFYSDDHGKSWQVGKRMKESVGFEGPLNESQVIEVTDKNGDKVLKLFCRNPGCMVIAESRDDGKSWSDWYYDTELINPDCETTVVNYPYPVKELEGKQVVLYAGCNSSFLRTSGTVHLGYYEPETDRFVWVANKLVNEFYFMYSCLSVIAEDRVGIIYEIDTMDTSYAQLRISDFDIQL